MNKGNWDKQEKIFHEALVLTGSERNSFLLKACSEDTIQISEIESLILAFENDGNFLEKPVFDDGLRLFGENNPQNPANSNIGFYQIRGKIGEGGMGEVYDALDTKLNRRVALKFLSGSLNDDKLAKRQLIREAQAAALLDHPNICAVHGIEQTEQHHFIVMQFIEGLTLAEFIKQPPVNQPPIAIVARQIISAVAFAHSHGVIHRDLKPANIMLNNDGQIKVLDFGLAKTVGQISNLDRSKENDSLISQKGLIIGTVSYMSPEQLRGERLDYQTDIFSIGIILYELVFRRNPFTRNSQAEIIASILSDEPPVAKDLKTNNHAGLSAIIQKCLQKDKAKRFQSAAEILVELDTDEQRGKTVNSGFKIKGKTAIVFLMTVLIFSIAFAYLFFYPAQPPKHSFAVLPITNETEQSEYQYLADGLTHDLIENLSGLSTLNVKKESYISRFKEQPAIAQTAGRELNVDAVLVASLSKRADSLFLDFKIIKTADGSVLDAAEFPIRESDLIAVRENISNRIISEMQPRLTAQEKNRLAQNNTQSPEAVRLYFRGRYFWNRRGPDDLKNAIRYFTEATNQDPSYARAWVGLADSYAFYSVPGQSGTISSEEANRMAKAAAKNALQIDETLSEPYSSMGTIKLRFEWDWVGAEQNFRTAISLDPEYAPAHYGLSNLLLITGRYEEALAEAQKMKEFDPFSISSELNIGRIYYFKRDDEATRIYQELLKKHPDNTRVLYLLGFQYLKIGKLKEATEIFEKIYDSNPLLAAAALGHCYGKSGQKAKAQKVLQKLEQLSEENYVSAQEKAIIYLGLGDADKVYAYLEQACREKFPAFPYLISDPLLDEIRSDQRFLNLKQCARL